MNLKTTILSSYFCKITKLSNLFDALALHPPPSLSLFLNSVVIATEHEVEMIPGKYSLNCLFSLEDVLHRSIEYLLYTTKQSNVLSLGYTIIREGYKRSCISGSNHVQVKAPNTIVMFLKTRSWGQLHELIGDDVMMHLLQKTSLFLTIEHGCYVQLCGIPLTERAMGKCVLSDCNCFGKRTDVQKERGTKRHRQDKVKVPKTKRRKLGRNKEQMCVSNSAPFPPLAFRRNGTTCLAKGGQTTVQPHEPTLEAELPKKKDVCNPVYLHRSRIFYSKTFVQGFHKKHVLVGASSSQSGVYTLLNSIFHFDKRPNRMKRLPKHLVGVKNLIKGAILNFKALKLRRLLDHYCPIPQWAKTVPRRWLRRKGEWNLRSKMYYKFAVKSFASLNQVYKFTRRTLLKVFPPLLWGSEENKRTIFAAVFNFLSLGRYERVTTRNLMAGVKTSHFTCFGAKETRTPKHVQSSLKKQSHVQTFIEWIFNNFIVPLLRGCFYITETGVHKNKIIYYRKPVWRLVRCIGLQPLLGGLFKPVTKRVVEEKISGKECMGVHDIRLLPGQTKIRPIGNLTKCLSSAATTISTRSRKPISINEELRALHLVLQYEFHVNPGLFGVGVSSADQIYERWRDFVINCKTKHACVPKLYFMSLDIKRCFDTLPQDRLLNLAPDCLTEEHYTIKKFVKIKLGRNGCVSKKYVSKATDGFDCSNFVSFIRKGLESGRIVARNAVFIDKVYYRKESRDKLLSLLRKHTTCSIGHVGDRYLLQNTGIAQGSVLATTLNNMHYGDIETKQLVSTYQTVDSFFIRWVDDYLFVTTSQQLANSFLQVMLYNMPRYGCHLNLEKTRVNFKFSSNGQKFDRVKEDWFPWCGYMFNSLTLECSYNYLQYIGENIRDGMTFQYGSHPGHSMSRQLILAVCVKANPLIADSQINSISNINKNIYQVFRLAALKFLAHVKALNKGQGISNNILFCYKLVKKLPLKFFKRLHHNFLKYRHKKSQCADYRVTNTSFKTVNRRDVKTLCYQAFVDVLRPKQSTHTSLIRLLIADLKSLDTGNIDVNELRERSEYFNMIKI